MSSIMLSEKEKCDKLANLTLDPGTSYEVFRNNTTAVEVIVKDVYSKNRKKSQDFNNMKMDRAQAETDKLHYELDNTNKTLMKTRNGFQTIVAEMRKQIDAANSREATALSANLALKLQNEKLRVLLESKTKLLARVKKELAAIKRVLKFVVKSICDAPEIPGNFERGSDTEYEEFENDLRENGTVRISTKISDRSDTFDTTVSKDRDFGKKV